MSLTTLDCWRLIIQSRLLTKDQCQQLREQYVKDGGGGDGELAKPLIKWMISKNILSRYQGSLLLAGQAGPFFYGSYKIYDRIEQGRLAGAFRAVHAASNHPVVLQFLAGELAQDEPRWRELAATLPRYEHLHMARCYDAVEVGGYRFFVMEDLRGSTAEEYLIDKGKMPPAEACRLVRRVALALDHLHQQGRPHGDVRPANLWIEGEGWVKLLIDPATDLGPLDLTEGASERWSDRADYLAPEMAVAKSPATAQTDIYALGCTLFELCVGRPPFAGGSVTEKLQRHAKEAIQTLPKPLGQMIAYMMAKNPAARFSTAQEVAERIKPLADRAKTPLEPGGSFPTESAFLAAIKQEASSKPASAPTSSEPVAATAAAPDAADPATKAAPVKIVPAAPPGTKKKKTSRSAVAERIAKAKARKRRNNLLMISAVLLVLIGGAGLAYQLNLGGLAGPVNEPVTPPVSPVDPATPPNNIEVVEDDVPAGPIEDDGESLWATPTDGESIDLKYLPGGAQIFVVARLSEIVSDEEGQRVLRALGPSFESAFQAWQRAAGVEASHVDQLILGMYGNDGQFPRVAAVVRLHEPLPTDQLVGKWGNPTAEEANAFTLYSGNGWSYLVPPEEDGQVFVMGDAREIKDLAESDLAPPLLRREVGKLLRMSDRQLHATILFAPSFLSGDGNAIFSGERQKALRPLQSFLGAGLKAAMASAHFGEELTFVEMRMESDVVIDHFTLASNMRDRLAQLPDRIESYIARLNPHPYWRLVAFRYPSMVRFLHQQTRVGVEDDHAVINAALPRTAAHNLVFGGEMVLASTPGAAAPVTTVARNMPQTVEQLLQSKMSISFDQDSLEFAMKNIENEVSSNFEDLPFDFKIQILGDDLKLDGITRNQQIRDFNQSEKTVAEVLTAMVMKANPVTTVTSPSEPDQKLLWVVGPDPADPSKQIVLITTRQVATGKYTLPEIFRTP